LLLQNAGRFADAVKDWKRLDQMSERSGRPGRAEALNGLAYAQALAKTELEEALDKVNEALKLANDEPSITAAASDTRGYLLYLMGHYEEALANMNVAVHEYEKLEKALASSGGPSKPSASPDVNGKLFHNRPKSLLEIAASGSPARAAAVVRYHRALVWK